MVELTWENYFQIMEALVTGKVACNLRKEDYESDKNEGGAELMAQWVKQLDDAEELLRSIQYSRELI